ncbi:MAG: hypothetical protein ACK5M4_11290 [Pseudorhodobacter sp.]
MIVLAGMVLGAAIGARIAIKQGGRKLDALQYAAGFGIAFGLLGVFVTIFLARMS